MLIVFTDRPPPKLSHKRQWIGVSNAIYALPPKWREDSGDWHLLFLCQLLLLHCPRNKLKYSPIFFSSRASTHLNIPLLQLRSLLLTCCCCCCRFNNAVSRLTATKRAKRQISIALCDLDHFLDRQGQDSEKEVIKLKEQRVFYVPKWLMGGMGWVWHGGAWMDGLLMNLKVNANLYGNSSGLEFDRFAGLSVVVSKHLLWALSPGPLCFHIPSPQNPLSGINQNFSSISRSRPGI